MVQQFPEPVSTPNSQLPSLLVSRDAPGTRRTSQVAYLFPRNDTIAKWEWPIAKSLPGIRKGLFRYICLLMFLHTVFHK